MELFDYLMAKKGHNTHRDLFSYLLGKKGSGTYTTFSGTSLNISNTSQAKIKNIALEGNTSQDGTPTPDTPIPIKVVTGEQSIEIKNSDSTLSQTYPLSLGNIELARINNYKDYIFKNEVGSPYYNADLDLNGWYLHKKINKVVFDGSESSWNWNPIDGPYLNGMSNYGRPINYSPAYCNYFINSQNITWVDKHFGFNSTGSTIWFKDSDLFIDLETFKAWLQTNNAIVYYVLATLRNTKITDTTLIQQLENINNNARSYSDTTYIICSSESEDNETIGFSGEIKVTSVSLGNSLNTSLLSSNIQEGTNIDDIQEEQNLDEIEEQNDEPIENEEIEEPIEEYQEL